MTKLPDSGPAGGPTEPSTSDQPAQLTAKATNDDHHLRRSADARMTSCDVTDDAPLLPVEPSSTLTITDEKATKPSSPRQPPQRQQSAPAQFSPCTKDDHTLLQVENEWIARHDVPRPPYKSICFSILLVIIGTVFVTVGVLIFVNVIVYPVGMDKFGAIFWSLYAITPYGLVLLGILCLIPGIYHIHLSISAALGQPNYSWDDFVGNTGRNPA